MSKNVGVIDLFLQNKQAKELEVKLPACTRSMYDVA